MKITVNGKQVESSNNIKVSQLLVEQKVQTPEYVSVELNGQILDRSEFDTKYVQPDDAVEFLYFMGGGGQ